MTTLREFFKTYEKGDPLPSYIYNVDNEDIIGFEINIGEAFYDLPWRIATQEEVDSFNLRTAKEDKISELASDKDSYLSGGYEYKGEIFCTAWSSLDTYKLGDIVAGSDSSNYESLTDDNRDNDPVSSLDYWRKFYPLFTMTDCCILNLDSKCKLDTSVPDRYHFYDKGLENGIKRSINFGDATHWSSFVKTILGEQNRVMRKYCDYKTEIARCATVSEVEAIVIDFST